MRSASVVLAAVLLAGAAAVPSAQVAAADAVQVLRGATVETVRVGATSAGVVEVVRGQPVAASKPPATTRASIARGLSSEVEVLAGQRIWFLDRAGDRLSVCSLRGTVRGVGRRAIRCSSRAIPQGIEGF